MSIISDPFLLTRTRPGVIRRTLSHDNYVFEFVGSRLDGLAQMGIHSKTHELVSRFCPDEDGQVAETLPPVGGEPVSVTPSALGLVATLLVSQSQAGADGSKWIASHFIAMMVDDMILKQMVRLANDVTEPSKANTSDPLEPSA